MKINQGKRKILKTLSSLLHSISSSSRRLLLRQLSVAAASLPFTTAASIVFLQVLTPHLPCSGFALIFSSLFVVGHSGLYAVVRYRIFCKTGDALKRAEESCSVVVASRRFQTRA